MNRAEFNKVLATEAATRNQVGAIHREFERLGFGEAERAARLAVSAAMLGLGDLGSTRDLTMGDAGRLVQALREVRDRGELPGPGRPGGQDRAPTLAELVKIMAIGFLRMLTPAPKETPASGPGAGDGRADGEGAP